MKNKLLAMMGIIITMLVIFGVSGRLLAKLSEQEGVENRAIAGAALNASVVNGRISYQGYLTDPATGDPLTGSYNMTFRLWDVVSGGTQVGADIVKSNVAVADGLFNVTLDIPDETFDGQGRWIQIEVGGELLNPRREILPVPYALSLRPGALISGTTDSSYMMHIANTNTSASWAGGIRVAVESDSDNSLGIWSFNKDTTGWSNGLAAGTRSGDGAGIVGYNEAASGGHGVWAEAQATSGWAIGVYGETSSADGVGVVGYNDATTGWARGVSGESISPGGIGVAGLNSAGGNGVFAYSTTGAALYVKSDSGWLIHAVSVNDVDTEFYVSNDGNVYADGTYQSPAADFAEMLPAHEGLEPGDVLIIGADGQLTLSLEAYQTSVVGVYSTAPAFLGGATEDADTGDNIPLSIVGIVPVKVSAENGPIQPGDLLTTSDTPGYAMVCHDRLNCIGAIIGKALEPLTEGTGIISVLITLQ